MRIERFAYDESKRLQDESIFSLASGSLGIRGCFEEGCPEGGISIRGAYINGFSEMETISYNEKLFGFPEEKQTIVNLPDAQTLEVYADGKNICCWQKEARDYYYVLDMENGKVLRSFTYDTGKGLIKISYERLVSFKRQGLFAIRCKVKSLSYKGSVEVDSILKGDVKNFTSSDDPRIASGSGKMLNIIYVDNLEENELQKVIVETKSSKRQALTLVKNIAFDQNDKKITFDYRKRDTELTASFDINIKENEEISIIKYCFYVEIPSNINETKFIDEAIKEGFDNLLNEQKDYMSDFWNKSRVIIDSNEIKQEHVDFCLYEMLSAAGKDGKTSVAAKGLSGEGYEGHYFWDCETYIYPFFLVTNPEIAKSLILYRYSKLEDAKKHARSLGHRKGALYPWRTITGSECSSYFPSGSAQYHINGDIARAFIQYYNVTQDDSILEELCEVLLETSRLWLDVGHFKNHSFKIDCVTGPDEYTCLVNNNYYTNAAAANNLKGAARLLNIFKKSSKYKDFSIRCNVNDEEIESFIEAANKMYYPYDESLGIIKQDDSFLSKKKVPLSSFPKEDFPLLLHYHPLYLYRLQICKQADAVLADHLFCNLDASTSKRTLDYYEEVTTHDSSLSKCIFGIVAAKLGDLNKAKEYFIETLSTDLDDDKGNTRDGLHLANMGGCYRMVAAGFGGLQITEKGLSLFPMLPEGINSYSFSLTYQGVLLHILVNKDKTIIKPNKVDSNISISVYGNDVLLNKEEIEVRRICKEVIFDLDGVITDTAIYHFEAWKKLADELSIPFDLKKNESFKGVSRKTCLELLLKWGNKEVSNNEFDILLNRKNEYYKELLKNLTPESILPGIKETLSILKDSNVKIALFSVSKNTPEILKRLNLESAFDTVVSGYDIKNSKPSYDGYLLAADRLNTDPRLCVMVEDSIAGIQGAKALSMKTIAIMDENKANADICIDSSDKLTNIVSYL